MMNNLRLIGVIFLSVLLLTNCKKDDKVTDNGQGEVVFSTNKTSNFDKSAESNCELTVSYAFVVVNEMTYNLPVFYIDGMITTQAIKLDAGDYTLEEFILMNDNETPEILDDDIVVMASVNEEGEFANYVEMTLPYDFTVEAFLKVELHVEVICYYPEYYDWYGFEFFTVWVTNIHEWFFFGDLCLKAPYEYEESLYAEQSQGLQVDVPAIFEIEVWRNEEYLTTFSNESFLGENNPLKITYADREGILDEYELRLNVLVKVGDGFEYVYFYSWFFTDVAELPTNGDGVTDFVIGNCVYDAPDLLLAPWMNLPMGITYDCVHPGENSYFDITLSNIGPGYDIQNGGPYEGWCADLDNTIGPGAYIMDAKSSLYPELLPGVWQLKGPALNACNWLFNNLDNYVYTPEEMQDALWCLFDGVPCTGVGATMVADALNHQDFSPLPGGWAAVLFFDVNDDPFINTDHTQITFFVVDP